MSYTEIEATKGDAEELAELRVESMKESLVAIGRFDPQRSRSRFLDSFVPEGTYKLYDKDDLIGFYAAEVREDHIFLSHLYIRPERQGKGVGAKVVTSLKQKSLATNLPIRLGALRESRSNSFYRGLGFQKTHEEEWDIFYEFVPS